MKVASSSTGLELVLVGDFDAGAGAALEPAFSRLLAGVPAGTDAIVLDFTNVRYMDSAGFSVWVDLERRSLAAGRPLRVRGAPPLVCDLFTFADLEEVLLR